MAFSENKKNHIHLKADLLASSDGDLSLMQAAMTQLNLSARTYHRILKLVRTITGLAVSEEVLSAHWRRRCNSVLS